MGLIWWYISCLCLLHFCVLHGFFFCMDLHVSQQVQLGQKAPLLLGSLRNQKIKALSQVVLQTDVTNTKTKGLFEIVVFSVWVQSGKDLSLLVTFMTWAAVTAAGGTGLSLGLHLSDQACWRHQRQQGCLSTFISQEQQKSTADTVICLWHKIRPSQSDHWPSTQNIQPNTKPSAVRACQTSPISLLSNPNRCH